MSREFSMQRAGSDGWFFAKSKEADIFLFGETLQDVQAQMPKAIEALEKARAARLVRAEVQKSHWIEMPLEACC